MRKIITAVIVFCLLLSAIFGVTASADTVSENQDSFSYTYWKKSVSVPTAYSLKSIFDGTKTDIGGFKNPSDFYVDDQHEELYILDSGNGRIVVVDKDFECKRIIDKFSFEGEVLDITGSQGIFVDEKQIVISDTENARILVCDQQGNVKLILTKPDAASFGKETVFKPTKVIADTAGNYYAVCSGVYKGAVVYDSKGNYVGLYGSNEVTITIKVLANSLWKKILNEEQTSQMVSAVPVEFSNLDIDKEGFIYSCTKSDAENRKNTIRKLNYAGDNVLKADAAPVENKFGILDFKLEGVFDDTQFTDVHIAEDGIISAVDRVAGKVFQYDQEGRLVSIFADSGQYAGSFVSPSAIEFFGDNYIVLDNKKNNISVFTKTKYGETLFKAIALYNDGKYEDSFDLWNEILVKNSNCEIAYQGMADALYSLGRAGESLKYYKMAYDQEGYSEAFEHVRGELLKKYFPVMMAVLVIICILPFVLMRLKNKKNGKSKLLLYNKEPWRYPFRMIIHPTDTCQDMRFLKKERVGVAVAILLVWYFVSVLKEQLSGFLFNLKPIGDVNIILILLSTVGIFFLFTIANWSIATLTDGEGNYKQIFCSCSYALIPAIIGTICYILLSNVLTIEESVFATAILWLGNGYSIFLIIIGLKHEHQYEGKDTIKNFIFSLIGLFIIIFLILLVFSLMQQLYVFVRTVMFEVSIRDYV